MAVRATGERVHKKLRNLTITAIVLFAVGVVFAFLMPSAMDGNKVVDEGLFWLSFFGVFVFGLGWLVPWSWSTVYSRHAKTVGKNLKYGYDSEGIYLKDTAEGKSIEKTYNWQDIKYVQLQRFAINLNKGTHLTGMLFVLDEDKFFKSLKQRKRKTSFEQRDSELDGGFFVIAETNELIKLANLWGGRVR